MTHAAAVSAAAAAAAVAVAVVAAAAAAAAAAAVLQLFFCLPGAEDAVAANGWSLFRQIMGSSVSQPQVEAYVQQLSQPGTSMALRWLDLEG
jgi:hypothetical protein